MPPAQTAATRLPSLTALRFPAALAVFVCHAVTLGSLRHERAAPTALFLLGPAGLSLFFVLSGFVLTWSAREADTSRAFWRRRVLKIYPSHLVVLALLILWVWVLGMPRPDLGLGTDPPLLGDVANASLLNALVPLPQIITAGNLVTWSLTCELLFYALFPRLFRRLARVPTRLLPHAAACTVAVACVVPALALGLDGPRIDQSVVPLDLTEVQMWVVYSLPPTRLPEFVLGMILARMHGRSPAPRTGVVAPSCLLAAVLLTGPEVLPAPFLPAAVTLVPIALLVRAAAAASTRERVGWSHTPLLVYLGTLSYAFYLLHLPVLTAVQHGLGRTWTAVPVAVTALAATLSASLLLHTFVERPCIRLFSGAGPVSRPREDRSSV
ncbi:acyltransferase family protein [Streptomyces sp. NPDC020607]|uniref:acyltransferase family protein n=1 Tax=Streptomyces sp. NPDC020607 TaxID=3365082 RepID=UPI0037A8D5BC